MDGIASRETDGMHKEDRMRVLYFYLMRNAPDRIRTVAPNHAMYWGGLALPDYLGGPFADRSGGLISFEVASFDEAERLVAEDPFVREVFWNASG
jgi:hypothetical protein